MINRLKSIFSHKHNHLKVILEVVVPSPKHTRDLVFAPGSSLLPSSLDLIPDVFEIEQQGLTNTCTANAACSVLEIAYKLAQAPKGTFLVY